MLFLFKTLRTLSQQTFLLPVLALFAVGCDSTLAAEDYDQTCKTASDCVAVLVGDMCGCGCDTGAIAKSALPKYDADDKDARDSCVNAMMCGPCPAAPPVTCTAGKCALTQ